ncbi:MAG: hypothetical protein FJY92_03660, partial [Candidatus Hydrogenedentes bacterium]|nr:hypothetical protein [Candidatus Hydrogenedentota bacterium]
MRIRLVMAAAMISAISTSATADAIDGKAIVLEAGDHASVNAPVSLPCDGPIGDGDVVRVIEPKTGKEFPATVRDGQLTFVPEGAAPGSEHFYTVKVTKENVAPRVQIVKNANGTALDVTIEDAPFTAYHYEKESRKPYLWPVLSDGSAKVTREYPMGPGELTQDHPHHRSFWTSYGDVNGADCWDERNERAGWQETNEVTYGSGDAYGWIHAKNTWADKDRKPLCREEREYRFYYGEKSARLVDVKVTFAPIDQDVRFGDTKEGGIVSFRMRDSMTEKEKKGGIITNAEGKTGMNDTWGKPSPWCDYSGPVEGAGTHGIAVFDHPANLRYPTTWHVRDYGLFGANCFGYSYFT